MKRSLIFSIIFSILILTACLFPRSGGVSTPAATSAPSETSSPAPTATPTETPIPRVEAVICTSENFLDKDHEVDPESLFDGTYLEALRRTLSTPFDPAKIKNVPLWGSSEAVIYAVVTPPNFKTVTTPNFDPNKKDTWPFQRFVTGYTVYRGITYAVMPIKFWNPKGEDSIVITLFKFDPASDDARKKEAIKLWEDKMHITPILFPHRGPADPLIDRTIAKYPDWRERFRRFINNNMYDASGQDMTALDGMVLLTSIKDFSWFR